MKPYTLTTIDNEKQWNEALNEFEDYHFLQSWQWGEIKAANGWKASRFLVKEKDKNIAAFQLLTKRVHPRVPITVGYAPRGPVFDSETIDLPRLLNTIEHTGKNRGCAYVKVDTDIDETSARGEQWLKALRTSGWQFSTQQVQTKNTGVTDLLQGKSDGEDMLLANMKKTWRYNIRVAGKRGVTVREGDSKDIAKFYKLYKVTGERQKFGIRNLEYYREVYRAFHDGAFTDSMILLSEHPNDEEPLASAVFIRFKEKAWYFYAASSTNRRADMPNYPMQWEAMKWARNNGAKTYDWGGASTNLDDPNDPMARVWHFKKGFGAEFFSGAGAWDKPIDTPKWYMFTLLTKLRKGLGR